jgi:hypothetical protein
MFIFETNVHEGEIFLELFGVRVVLELIFQFLVKLIDKSVFGLI